MAGKNKSPVIITNATGAGLADEPLFKRAGSVKASEGMKAIKIHVFDTSKYYSIPITDIKLILYEMAEGKADTIGVLREYPDKRVD